jgi:hypothetical protein
MGGDAGIEVGRATPGVVGAAFVEVVWFEKELLICSAALADVTAAVAVEFMDHETVEL